MFTLNDLLDIAIKMEENGKKIYQSAKAKIGDRELKSLLQWMADEEDCHSKWFSKLKEKQDPDSEDLQVMLPDVLREMMGEKSLSLDDVDFSGIKTSGQMLAVFIEFENDTILFYEFLETFIEDAETLAGLKKIIREETAHADKLRLMIQSTRDEPVSF
ncbi:ferritin family protein [Desulfospira joergensenii]|uniref:ferritin family protein n=1 Tax=Desulfospira joergensenii TaxID=53329 RepID=UPI0003B6CE65|nr:ferritin family protein [Desulfospira joergensenii]